MIIKAKLSPLKTRLVSSLKPLTTHPDVKLATRYFKKLVRDSRFKRNYLIASAVLLCASSILWAIAGARINSGNADQLVDPYLFKDGATFHGAIFPSAHTFLLKWPVFALIALARFSPASYYLATIGLVMVTVAFLAYVIYRIDRRPLVAGTLLLGLASSLMLVPAQPYAGALLPVNMAMMATRNVEYVLYVLCIITLARSKRMRTAQFWVAVAGLSLLAASDKLFVTLGIGGALLGLVIYALADAWQLVRLSVRWLVAGLISALGATVLLTIISHFGLTHISGQSATGPYGLVSSSKDLFLGIYYGLMGLLTNFGANPAFDATTLGSVFHTALSRLISINGPSFVINGVILLFTVCAALRLTISNLMGKSRKNANYDIASKLSTMLVATSLTAIVVFVAANHYYAVDARYLTICLFAGFIVAANHTRAKRYKPERLVLVGALLLVSISLSIPSVIRTTAAGTAVANEYETRNARIGKALLSHPVNMLLGDYWRVVPTKYLAANKLSILPLQNCTTPRDNLTSAPWHKSLQKHSFAYLLSLNGSRTDYPNCTIKQVSSVFGRPNATLLVAGSYDSPKELLLFYDHGVKFSAPRANSSVPAELSLAPTDIKDVPYSVCYGPTVMNIVAHQDDDLLFLSPDLLHSLHDGNCVRTIYLTAGDSGNGAYYWANRQRGSEAAYSSMINSSEIWVQRIIKLADGRYVTISNPRGNSKVSLIYMNLPDGNLKGEGFHASHYESLAKLRDGHIGAMDTVDGQSSFTASQIITDLSALMHLYQPSEIRTQADAQAHVYTDHADHSATKWFVQRAYAQYEHEQFNNLLPIPLKYYIGYPIRERDPNVSGDDLTQKEMTFLIYAKYDGSVCGSVAQCDATPTYGNYLTRQYQQE